MGKPNSSTTGNASTCSKKANFSNLSNDKKEQNLSNGNESVGAKKVYKYQVTVPKEAKKAIMKNKPFEVEKILKSTPVSNKEEKLLRNTLVSGVEKVLKSTPVSNKQP